MSRDRLDMLAERAARRLSQRMCARVYDDGPAGVGMDFTADLRDTLMDAATVACGDRDVRRLMRELPDYQKEAINALYRKIAENTADSTMAKVRDRLLGSVADRVHMRPAQDRAGIRRHLESMGLAPGPAGSIQTAVRTHGAIAYNAAVWVATQRNPRVWGYEYVTADDERVRPQHSDMEGVRYPRRHLWWRRYAPPNGWNCRCRLRPIYHGDPDCRVLAFRGTPDVDFMFKFNPGMIFQSA